MDDRTTPTVCEACGADPDRKETCFWCERTGMMTIDRLALYRASRDQRVTGQFQAFQSIVSDMVEILKERRTPFTDALAGEGSKIMRTYDDALRPGSKMSQADRSRAVTELRAYHERVVDYLARKR